MAVVLRYIPEREEVRDVLQDSFVKILTSVGKFDYRGEGSLKSWISRIVSNCAIEHIREHERIAFVSDIPDSVDEEAPDIRDIPPDLLTELIGRLPANYRLVLNLFVYEQCSHKDIARRLGIKEGTSASHFFRAKKMLAKMIRDYQDRQGI